MPRRFQILREPERVEIPDRIKKDLGKSETPHKTRLEELPRTRNRNLYLAGNFRRTLIRRPPERQPDKAQQSNHHKRILPAIPQQDEGDQRRRDDRPCRRPRIEDPRCHRALILREPLRHDANCRGPVACLTSAQQESKNPQAQGSPGECMQNRCGGPPGNTERIAEACSEPINQRPRNTVHDCVGEQETEHHPRVRDSGHVELLPQNRGCHRQSLSIQVVDQRRQERERDHQPSSAACCVSAWLHRDGVNFP